MLFKIARYVASSKTLQYANKSLPFRKFFDDRECHKECVSDGCHLLLALIDDSEKKSSVFFCISKDAV